MSDARSLLQTVADQIHAFGALDLVGALVLLLFLILGVIHGFVGQAARFLAVALGIFVARAGEPHLAPVVGSIVPSTGPGVRSGIAYGLLFLLVLIATALAALFLKKAVTTLRLGFFDRLAGAVLGLATGALVHLAVLVCVVLFVKEERVADLSQGSRSLRAAFQVADTLSPALPAEARHRIEIARARTHLAPASRPEPTNGSDGR